MAKYSPQKIEKKWQKKWYASSVFHAKSFSKKEKFYLLFEFPYPSGDGLHVGHCRPYIALDVIARKRRAQGQNVLFPIGWDAFGLPTENYAIKTGVHPAAATKKNTDNFRRQMQMLGLSLDWSREINTTDPAYYKWTQWIFIKLFEKGLAYKDKIAINWCPKDKIGLANEEVVNGKCERCGTAVERREKEQWLIKITKYADRLAKDLDFVDYPERVKVQQREWIGKSEGAEIEFVIPHFQYPITVFTTRPDTLFGCTFLVLAPEHPLIGKLKSQITNWREVEGYIARAKDKSDIERQEAQKEKTGILLQGVTGKNPANGEAIPLFVADYVMPGYGTGAVMGVPGHDARDFAFAKKYTLPEKEVVVPNIIDRRNPPVAGKKFVARKNVHAIVKDPATGNYLALKWKKFDWVTFPMGGVEEGESAVEAARREVKEETGYVNLKLVKVLEGQVRAEYFAAHKDENRISLTTAVVFELAGKEQEEISQKEKEGHDIIWLDASHLTYEHMTHAEVEQWKEKMRPNYAVHTDGGVLINSGQFDGMDSEKAKWEVVKMAGGKKVAHFHLRDWVFSRQHYWGEPIPLVRCEKCGWVPVAEKDLPVKLPKVEKYQPTDTGESPLSAIAGWVDVDCPVCGGAAQRETDTMPNWAGSNWYYLAYVMQGISNFQFPISKYEKAFRYWMPVDWYNGGMEHTVLHLLYSRFIYKFLWDIGAIPKQLGSEPYKKRTSNGVVLGPGGVKMSKSKGNVVSPDEVVKKYGADTLRVYEMFMGPFEQMIPWDEKGIVGSRRFIEKVYLLASRKSAAKRSGEDLAALLHKTIKKVGEDIESLKFNTAVSALMEFTNAWHGSEAGLSRKDAQKLLVILSPFAPHAAEELWLAVKGKGACSRQPWPAYDEALLATETIVLVVQVNGKVRDKMEMQRGLAQEEAKKIILASPKIKQWTEGRQINRIFFVPDKLINIVLS